MRWVRERSKRSSRRIDGLDPRAPAGVRPRASGSAGRTNGWPGAAGPALIRFRQAPSVRSGWAKWQRRRYSSSPRAGRPGQRRTASATADRGLPGVARGHAGHRQDQVAPVVAGQVDPWGNGEGLRLSREPGSGPAGAVDPGLCFSGARLEPRDRAADRRPSGAGEAPRCAPGSARRRPSGRGRSTGPQEPRRPEE